MDLFCDHLALIHHLLVNANMVEETDYIALFAKTKNFVLRPRTVFVEGTTDVELFTLAARLEMATNGLDLLGDKLAIVAAGEGDLGGARGVCRELVSFKNMAGGYLLPNGHPKYRFIGLFDNDNAGRRAVSDVRKTDLSILEYKDVFRLQPIMPLSVNPQPHILQKSFESENEKYMDLDWELEDLLPKEFTEVFLREFPDALRDNYSKYDKVHRNWTSDGKARLHRFIKDNAIHSDLIEVISILKALRHYLYIKLPDRI